MLSTTAVDNSLILKEAALKFLPNDSFTLKPTSGGVNNVVQVQLFIFSTSQAVLLNCYTVCRNF